MILKINTKKQKIVPILRKHGKIYTKDLQIYEHIYECQGWERIRIKLHEAMYQ